MIPTAPEPLIVKPKLPAPVPEEKKIVLIPDFKPPLVQIEPLPVQENIKKLKSRKVEFVEPAKGKVACGDEGQGKLADIEAVFKAAENALK